MGYGGSILDGIPDKMADGVKNVVLDLGGVLLRWAPAHIASALFANRNAQEAVISNLFGHADWQAYDMGLITLREVVDRFNTRTGFAIRDEELLLQVLVDSLDPMPDSILLLEELSAKGLALYCLSNVSRAVYDRIKARNPFCQLFQGSVISGDLHLGKPDRAIFRYLLTTFELRPDETVMIDDMPRNIEGACCAGMKGIVFSSCSDCRDKLASMGAGLTKDH